MAIGAGLDFVGGFLGRSGGGKAARQQLHHQLFLDNEARAFNERWNQKQLDFASETRAREDTQIRRRVADAKGAGLHPLFALGAGGTSPVSFMPGQSSSGSAMGAGIKRSAASSAVSSAARGLRAYGNYQQAKEDRAANAEMRQLQLEEQRLRNTQLGWEVFNQQQAALKVAEQSANQRRVSVLPEKIPTEIESKLAHGSHVPVQMRSGRWREVLNPDKYDELSQVDMAVEIAKDMAYQWWQNVRHHTGRSSTWDKGGPLRIRITKARGGEK